MRNAFPIALLALSVACASEDPTGSPMSPANDSRRPAESSSAATTDPSPAPAAGGLYALRASSLDDEPVNLSEYRGQVTLVVNVASRCGYTGQYAGLQELHAQLSDRGFAVLGFPSNEFGGQEPGSPEEIREFCTSLFGVTFPMFAKCEVKPGQGQAPVYAFLEEQTGEVPGWNFCKYLVGRDGQVIAFFESKVAPDAAELREAIEAALG